MKMSIKNQISIEELLIAYRNVKNDLFYEKGHNNLLKLAEFESDLLNNIKVLQDNLNTLNIDYFKSSIFLGSYDYILKEIIHKENKNNKLIYFSDTGIDYEKEKIKDVKFRYIGNHSVEFHIISSLWINKVGAYLEKRLNTNCYGSRLINNTLTNIASFQNVDLENFNVSINTKPGNFKPYQRDYKNWQNNAIKAIDECIKNGKSLVVLTADIEKFYHAISPTFITDTHFLDFICNKELNTAQIEFNTFFIGLLEEWSKLNVKQIPNNVKKNRNNLGIPIGLSASKVIGNLFLAFFDQKILNELAPIFYGRYVDDIILVIENTKKFKNSGEIWSHLKARIKEIGLNNTKNNTSPSVATYTSPFGHKDVVRFGHSKQKIFVLDSNSGSAIVETIKNALNESSSEWRLLPDSEDEIEELNKQITTANANPDAQIDSLRMSDGLSIQRLKFSISIRNFEAMVEISPEFLWKNSLEKFLNLCTNHIISPLHFNTYYKFYPRIIGLAIKAKKIDYALNILKKFESSWKLVINKLKAMDKDLAHKAWQTFNESIKEAIISNLFFSETNTEKEIKLLSKYLELSIDDLRKYSKNLFLSDLHSIPFKYVLLNRIDSDKIKTTHGGYFDLSNILNHMSHYERDLMKSFMKSVVGIEKFKKRLPNASLFYTRTFNTLEITSLIKDWSTSENKISELNKYLKLFSIPPINIGFIDESNIKNSNQIKIDFKNDIKLNNPTIALTSFETDEISWIANVRDDNPQPKNDRFNRLFKLINEVISCGREVDYIVFPELSIPRHLLWYISLKLKSKGISLIAGIEYEKEEITVESNIKGYVSNQLAFILTTFNGVYHDQVLIIQEKAIPAFHEERELFDVGGKIMKPNNINKYIFKHNSFFFSGLICNELLNIDYRQPLRGEIDALFVVEWNKDIDMYDPIVSATSNDLHCFVVQVNNRKYGDTRLRGPYKESYERDKVRIRGGDIDYFVLATVQIKELREFQRNHRSPSKPFKPTPTGFKISPERRKLK